MSSDTAQQNKREEVKEEISDQQRQEIDQLEQEQQLQQSQSESQQSQNQQPQMQEKQEIKDDNSNIPQKQEMQLKTTEEIKNQIGNTGGDNKMMLQKQQSSKNSQNTNRKSEFVQVREIGRGAYGTVFKVRNKKNQYLAMKEVNSIKLKKDKKVHQVYMEKIMRHFKFPGIPQFHSCFTQDNYFYFLMEFAEGGQLSRLIKKYYQHFTIEVVQFYVAQMVLILEYIHSIGFSHRDFKPENLVLTKIGHLQLIDFGTLNDYCKKLIPQCAQHEVHLKDEYRRQKITSEKMREFRKRQSIIGANQQQQGNEQNKEIQIDLPEEDKEEIEQRLRSQTFCGTAEYLCPEMLEEDICDMNGDLWALGCIIYKMFTNNTPFFDTQEFLIFSKIKQGNYNRNHEQIPSLANDLISQLLKIDQHERLGSVLVDDNITVETIHQAYNQIKAHPFFDGIQWDTLYSNDPPQIIQQILSGQFLIQKQQVSNNSTGQNKSISDNDEDDEDQDDDEDDEEENDFCYGNTNQISPKKENPDQIFQNNNNIFQNNTESCNESNTDRNSLRMQIEQVNINLKKHKSSVELSSISPAKNNRDSYSPQLPVKDILLNLSYPFIESNLYFQVSINKINKHLLIFSTKRPRQILLFNINPITIIYYMPFRKQLKFKYIILDEKTNILLESPNKIIFSDSNEKYIFEDRNVQSPAELYKAIQSIKQSQAN